MLLLHRRRLQFVSHLIKHGEQSSAAAAATAFSNVSSHIFGSIELFTAVSLLIANVACLLLPHCNAQRFVL